MVTESNEIKDTASEERFSQRLLHLWRFFVLEHYVIVQFVGIRELYGGR